MTSLRRHRVLLALFVIVASFVLSTPASAQDAPATQEDHSQHMNMAMGTTWQFMQDGVVFPAYNHQGGLRGGDEFAVPHWWMGMASRNTSRGLFTVTGMLSLEAAAHGKDGYRELFQSGEVVDDAPLIDHQHPHDLFMEIAGVWRLSLSDRTAFTVAGGPAGEPALGPVAFMHRPSAAEVPFAPLGHHTFDSTHIAFGVVTAAVDHGRWTVEGSVFNGREPDEHRWDFDFGQLDSVSGRLWFRPDDRWEFQVSTGHLNDPEALEPGDVERTTVSGAWLERAGDDFTAVAGGWGLNVTDHGNRHATFGEINRHRGLTSLFSRVEVLQVETAKLLGTEGAASVEHDRVDTVGAFTFGAVRDFLRVRGFEGGLGAAITFYAVPEVLEPSYDSHPLSLQVFFRLRIPSARGRMWNMRMAQPMTVMRPGGAATQ
ncbi:MAG TPA: hypothetical protein VM818_13535 [Vicinamibacterales bacterium]|jgi:hypothetical protein|nr:hypothetical protein [Vicinamibacterales bacterium]